MCNIWRARVPYHSSCFEACTADVSRFWERCVSETLVFRRGELRRRDAGRRRGASAGPLGLQRYVAGALAVERSALHAVVLCRVALFLKCKVQESRVVRPADGSLRFLFGKGGERQTALFENCCTAEPVLAGGRRLGAVPAG